MLSSLLIAAAASAAASCAMPQQEVERQATLAYSAFDSQPPPQGWRHLSATGCVDAAVSLLTAYGAANADGLSAADAMELSFHVGQVLALSGRENESIAHIERSLRRPATPEWSAYVQATLAFLRRDAVALRAARDTYAAVAPDSMRLRFIDGFMACPNEPYATAVHCRLQAATPTATLRPDPSRER
jgi:hypothetical protein